MAEPPAQPVVTRPGVGRGLALLLVVLGILLNAPRLAGPFTDGQAGNCAAMFAIFERNEKALGLLATRAVPVVNPVPPPSVATAEFYAHHPPGLPWLIMLAGRLPATIEVSSRLVALALFLAATLLLADLAARLAGPGAAVTAGLLMLLLPAGRHDALLVNYETVALPALLLLLRATLLGVGPLRTAAALAALADWIAVLPLLAGPRTVGRRAWWLAVATSAAVLVGTIALGQLASSDATAGTTSQALASTFLAADFDAGEWLAALHGHVAALYGWVLLPATLSLLALRRQPALRRRALLWLLGLGLFNVVVFARHATGHEHFALLLLPWVCLATATLLFPGPPAAGPPRALAFGGLLLLLGLSTWQAERMAPYRWRTDQSELAAAFRASAPQAAIYVRPTGAPFVFLFGAQRHVAPLPAGSAAQARDAAETWRKRFELPAEWPAFVALAPGEPAPAWAAALGEPQVAGEFRLLPLR